MRYFKLFCFSLLVSSTIVANQNLFAQFQIQARQYTLWYDKPAPDLPIKKLDSLNTKALIEATPYDAAWENWSLPIGNGYLGASIFGRTATERIQLTENSMAARSLYGGVGLTNFAELYIHFMDTNSTHYSRSLRLNDAVATVKYEQGGVVYQREYFASYPDKVLVIKLTASQKGKLSFTLHPQIPYKKEFGTSSNNNGRMGTVVAKDSLITLTGKMEYLNLLFEGQFKVIPSGGTIRAFNDANNDNGRIVVTGADTAIIIIAAGTNYKLDSHVFLENNPSKKLADTLSPHAKVSSIIAKASGKTYPELMARHRKDYTNLFSRVHVDLGALESNVTTDRLLKNYRNGINDHYLEELYFHYGRYLLICSSRPGTLPPNLQGIWSQYDITPWTGGYWHNINIQMNYWPVFNTNLTELFSSFVDYNLAYRKAAVKGATQYIKTNNPQMLSQVDDGNGWTIGTGASAYNISTPGMHSGPGTGALTTKLFWDYYEFTGDKRILKELTYPAITSMSQFLSKVVIDTAGLLLTSPSFSPEQRRQGKEHYKTTGSAFDQQMIFENHTDVLKAAKILGDNNPFLSVVTAQLPKLDPVQVGWSGQIKEFREEKYYGDIGDPNHRHISQLLGLYPGTLINSTTPAWLDAAKLTLNRRGDVSTGWSMAFRLNLWARTKNGNRAYMLFQNLLKLATLDNLWNNEPPFNIDGNFGGTAGVAEMLIQSHEGFIDLLPALPQQWEKGYFSGLMARGNFEIAALWENGQANKFTIKSNIGGLCKLKYFNIQQAIIKDASGKKVSIINSKRDYVEFKTKPGETFFVDHIPVYKKIADPSNAVIINNSDRTVQIKWDKCFDAISYNVYAHFGNLPNYTLIKAKVTDTTFKYAISKNHEFEHCILKITSIDRTGRESNGAIINVLEK